MQPLILATVIVLVGCGSKATCVEGQSSPCACPSGARGAQVCKNASFGECSCTEEAKPTIDNADSAIRAREKAALEAAERAADRARAAKKAAMDARDTVDNLQRDLSDLDARVSAAVDRVVAAQSDTDRAAAKARLEQLRKEKAEVEERIRATSAATPAKSNGVKISAECQKNPLAKGCM